MPVIVNADKSEMLPYMRQFIRLLQTMTLKAKIVTEGIQHLMQIMVRDVEQEMESSDVVISVLTQLAEFTTKHPGIMMRL